MAASAEIARANGRKGGRPKGTTTRPQMRDFLTDADVKALVKKAKEMADGGNETMLKFVLEQLMGKAAQTVTGEGGGPIMVQFDNAFTSSTKANS